LSFVPPGVTEKNLGLRFKLIRKDIGLCDELITRPEESYLLWCVVVCDLETL